MSEIVVGIDLGTTYSAVAVYRNGKEEVIPINKEKKIMPSIVDFSLGSRILVGQSHKTGDCSIFGVKRFIGRSYYDEDLQKHMSSYPYHIINVDNKPMIEINARKIEHYTPEEISAKVLEKLKNSAERYLKCSVNKAVITVPAHFNDSQRQATKRAGRIAGLEVLRIINEPTAASLAYGLHNKIKKMTGSQNVLIYDFGGGTFDVSIITIENGIFEVKATRGEPFLGGDDIDTNLIKYFVDEFKQKYKIDLQENKTAIERIRLQCQKIKVRLSLHYNADIEICSINFIGERDYDLESTINRSTFNKINSKLFDKTLECVQKTLSDAKMKKEDIHEIILVGGSSRIPRIREMMQQYFNKTLNMSLNPDEAIAIGAAVQAAIMSNEEVNTNLSLLLFDVNPLSLGIETEGKMSVIIPRNTQIPTCRKRRYETSQHGISEVLIIVYEGESSAVKQNRKLGKFLIKFPPLPKGEIKFYVSFAVNVDGILNVSAMLEDQNLQIEEQLTEIGRAQFALREHISNIGNDLKSIETLD